MLGDTFIFNLYFTFVKKFSCILPAWNKWISKNETYLLILRDYHETLNGTTILLLLLLMLNFCSRCHFLHTAVSSIMLGLSQVNVSELLEQGFYRSDRCTSCHQNDSIREINDWTEANELMQVSQMSTQKIVVICNCFAEVVFNRRDVPVMSKCQTTSLKVLTKLLQCDISSEIFTPRGNPDYK